MKKILLLAALLYSTFAYTQTLSTGVIKNPDKDAKLRSGKGKKFEVVDKLMGNEVFTFYGSNEKWLKVTTTKFQRDEANSEIVGYLHRKKIVGINDLKPEKRKRLFVSIFDKEKELYQKAMDATDKTTKEHQVLMRKMNVYHDFQFGAVLGAFEQYLCEYKDRELLDKFLDVLEVEEGSADEMPSFTLGAIFMCEPEWTFQSMKEYVGLMKLLEWGIINIAYDVNEETSSALKKKYNELRASAGLPETDFSTYEE